MHHLPICHTTQVVYLSKNSLQSAAGVGQFQTVRVLTLADNLLEDLEEVGPRGACMLSTRHDGCAALLNAQSGGLHDAGRHLHLHLPSFVTSSSPVSTATHQVLDELTGLPCLEVLSLAGNPCASLPFYRPRVLARLRSLRMLDGKEVSNEERAASALLVDQESSYLAVMIRNACMVHKMVGCSRDAAAGISEHIAVRNRPVPGQEAWSPCKTFRDMRHQLKQLPC